MSGPRFDIGWALLLASFSLAILVPFNSYSEKEYALSTQGFIFSSKSLGLVLLLLLRKHSEMDILRAGLVSSCLASLTQGFLLEQNLNNELLVIVASRGLEGGGKMLLFYAFLLRIYPRHNTKSVVMALSLSVLAQLAGLAICIIFFSERVSGHLFLAHGLVLLLAFGAARCSKTTPLPEENPQPLSIQVPLKLVFKKGAAALLSLIACQLAFHFYEPLLLTQLQSYFAYNKTTVAFFYLATIVSMVVSGGCLLFLPIELNRSRILVLGPFISGVGAILSGPSKLLHLPITPYIIFSGLVLIGISCGILATAVLSDIVQRVRIQFPRFMVHRVIQQCVFVFVCIYFAGESVAHFSAGTLLHVLGVNSACDLIGLVCIVIGCVLLLLQSLDDKEQREVAIIIQQQDELSAMLGEERDAPRGSETEFRHSRN